MPTGPARHVSTSEPDLLSGIPIPDLRGEDIWDDIRGSWLTQTSGFAFTLREVEREELEEAIRSANTDDSVDGILVYYPVFNTSRDRTIQYVVDMHKDVEGLSPKLINNMYQNIRFLDPPNNTQKSILPCTPLAMIKILEYLNIYNTILDYGKRLWGRRITVINRSEVVGRPLAALLANDGAEVYSVDVTGVQRFHRGQGLRNQQHVVEEKPEMTMDDCLAISDVVISGVPGDKFKVPVEKIRDGAVCINFSSEKVSTSPPRQTTQGTRLTQHPPTQTELHTTSQRTRLHLRPRGRQSHNHDPPPQPPGMHSHGHLLQIPLPFPIACFKISRIHPARKNIYTHCF
jgi:5,10-methylene-tetrahydrofolate dehydrogenase/methenyl tetrahydrofolate cyclohydrolase